MDRHSIILLALLIAFLGHLEGKIITDPDGKQLRISFRAEYKTSCDIQELTSDESRIICETRAGKQVPNGERCQLVPLTLDRTLWAKCELGKWKSIEEPNTKSYHLLKLDKRSFTGDDFKKGAETGAKIGGFLSPVGEAVGAVLGGFVCWLFCKSPEPVYIVKKPPVYSNCPPSDLKEVYYAEKRKETAVVRWTDPAARDEDGSIKSNTQTSSPKNGGNFQGSVKGLNSSVTYVATDNDGLKGYCPFNVFVKVRACEPLARLENGHAKCDSGNIYGSTCIFICDVGYELTGDSSSTCQQDKSWTGTASCSRVQCPAPEDIPNGIVDCQDHSYQSTCSFTCHTGFALEGPVVSQCQADRTWSVTEMPHCIDAEPPTIECLTPQIFYADRGTLTTSVWWEGPTATDTVDQAPTISQIEGPSMGDVLLEGSWYVKYIATDATGNTSPGCIIELRVEAITCSHPSDALDDQKMIFNCSDSLNFFGVSCELSCDYNLPLEGVDKITCEQTNEDGVPTGVWRWGSGGKPNCTEIDCPELNPPLNGALVRESVNQRPVMIVMCNENYDISPINNFDGKIYCYDSGLWRPVNKTPDCIYPRNPRNLALGGEIYYYSGQCSDEATQQQIKQNFLTILTNEVDPLFNSICPGELTCTVDKVAVICGNVSESRKRRSSGTYYSNYEHHVEKREESSVAIVTFSMNVEWNPSGMTINEAFNYTDNLHNLQAQGIVDLIKEGAFDIPGFTLREDSFQRAKYGSLSCDLGMRLKGTDCRPCPRGMYLDEVLDDCQECPVGQYMDTDGSTTCKMCPQGYSTTQTGSKSVENCTKICRAGSYSKHGLSPCTFCPVGTYQVSEGMYSCVPCPAGQTTPRSGSTDSNECQYFDVLLRNTELDVPLGSIPSVESFSLVIWARLFSGKSAPLAAMNVLQGQEKLLTLHISPEISVEIEDELFETEILLKETKWFHIAVVWDSNMSSLTVYINGETTMDQTVSLPTFTFGDVFVYSSGTEGVYLSGLQIVTRPLTTVDILPLLASCTESLEPVIISADSFLESSNIGIDIITPAVCDAIDECASLPCGDHRCVNEIGDFRCVCSNGMTGKLCDVPPDHCIENECKNDATCNNHDTDYSCSCRQGYSGFFCEIPPVNGGWSEWEDWSLCSASCDGGNKIRSRTCNNPPPGEGGLDCPGPAEEVEDCNTDTCTACPDEPQRGFGVIPNCTIDTETGSKSCSPYCRDGTVMQPEREQFETYRCGPDTNFEWTPLPTFPPCSDPNPPRRYALESAVDYDTVIPSSAAIGVEQNVKDKLSTVDCLNAARCDATVSLDSSVTRRKRNTGSTLQIILEIVMGNDGELDLQNYVDTGNVSSALQDVIDAIVSLELTAADIQANASTYFDVEIGGVTYTISNSSLTLSGIIDCPDGSVSKDGVCVPCPVSSKAISNSCVFCDVGTYQDEVGQTTCKQCPVGYTTPRIGAGHPSECTVAEQTTTVIAPTGQSTGSSAKTTNGPDTHEKRDNKGIIAGIAIGSCAFVLAAIALALILYKKYTRKHVRNNETYQGSLSSLNMIRPSSSYSVVSARNIVVNSCFEDKGSKVAESETPLPPMDTFYTSQPPPYSP